MQLLGRSRFLFMSLCGCVVHSLFLDDLIQPQLPTGFAKLHPNSKIADIFPTVASDQATDDFGIDIFG